MAPRIGQQPQRPLRAAVTLRTKRNGGANVFHSVRAPAAARLRPLPLAVHDWRLTGLDVNRGISRAEVSGMAFDGKAAVPATGLP